jgi:periplasmic divalent cation tolerance protein
MAEPLLIVITTLPDREQARTLARQVVEARLAACVQVGTPVESFYRWQGAVEPAYETPLLFKTVPARYADLESFLQQHHPYALPEIIALNDVHGSSAYLDWVAQETQP